MGMRRSLPRRNARGADGAPGPYRTAPNMTEGAPRGAAGPRLYWVAGKLGVCWGGGCPMSTPIVDGGAGLGPAPGSEVRMTGDVLGPGISGMLTGAEKAGPGAMGFRSVPTRLASGSMLIGTGGRHPSPPVTEVARPSLTRTLE